MSESGAKRINLELPVQSFEIVKKAAELSGSTIRSFAAAAVLQNALRVVQSVNLSTGTLDQKGKIGEKVNTGGLKSW